MYSSFSPNSILKIGFGQSHQYLAMLIIRKTFSLPVPVF
jgi:hypothetical protein